MENRKFIVVTLIVASLVVAYMIYPRGQRVSLPDPPPPNADDTLPSLEPLNALLNGKITVLKSTIQVTGIQAQPLFSFGYNVWVDHGNGDYTWVQSWLSIFDAGPHYAEGAKAVSMIMGLYPYNARAVYSWKDGFVTYDDYVHLSHILFIRDDGRLVMRYEDGNAYDVRKANRELITERFVSLNAGLISKPPAGIGHSGYPDTDVTTWIIGEGKNGVDGITFAEPFSGEIEFFHGQGVADTSTHVNLLPIGTRGPVAEFSENLLFTKIISSSFSFIYSENPTQYTGCAITFT